MNNLKKVRNLIENNMRKATQEHRELDLGCILLLIDLGCSTRKSNWILQLEQRTVIIGSCIWETS